MSKHAIQMRNEDPQHAVWLNALTDLDAEIAGNPQLTEAEKRYLLEEMDQIPDEVWEPPAMAGEALSVTIINDRGERS